MAFLDTKHQRAALIVFALGAALLWAIFPYVTGIIGIPVLAVLFAPVHNWMIRRGLPEAPTAMAVTLLGAVIVVLPIILFAGLLINEAQQVAANVLKSPILERLSAFEVGGFRVGPRIAEIGGNVVSWMGASAVGLVGTATRLALNLTIAFFGLYYVLKYPGEDPWMNARPYVPFSPKNADKLGKRFRDVTVSTVIGTGVTAMIQGALLGAAFVVVGLPNAFFWSVVTTALAILPVVGSGLVWGPAAIVLALQGRPIAAIGLAVWGLVMVGSVDNFIRPIIYRRYAEVHPLITLIGAIAGVSHFGLLGLLIGPLALSYLFELVRMYREEYLEPEPNA
ncbi:MAG TPA: AI-2E family transporter [Gemmatimonadales bacterium]|nr:AI-2E family transporter [Gemmatimonadales bacterium]